ncbi:hypothetical protein Elgi_46970 [Paenibacillus elgii]|nr:hypothetical protein Elgi_46970 [Paenibacillus elgii]
MIAVTTATAIMETFMKSFIEQDMDSCIELFDENVVFEFPYAPDAYTRKLEGKTALYQHVKELFGMIEIDLFTAPAIHHPNSRSSTVSRSSRKRSHHPSY